MKNIIILLAILFVATSCSNDLENLNENIKDPAVVTGESLFTGASKALVDQIVDLNVNLNNSKLWSQYLQETTYTDESNYDQTTRSIPENHWRALYKDVLKDIDEAKKIILETTNTTEALNALKPNKLEILEILEVYAYSNLVETFGNVPYSEALDIENLTPAYEDGLTIYKDLISRLTVTIDALDLDTDAFDDRADLIYHGDVAAWKKFAASLKLRMGLLISDIPSEVTLAQSTVESAIASGVFQSNTDNATLNYLNSDPNTNPIHDNLVLSGRHDFVAGVTIVDMMNTLNDFRRPLYFTTVEGVYIGAEIGSTASYNSYSHVSSVVEAAETPGIIFDYSEVQFLLAEAAERGFITGDTAENHYNAGIMASFEFWGASTADAISYIAQPSVNYATLIATQTWKQVIATQSYLALYNRGMEAWTSIRKLDFPVMAPAAEAVSGFPNRYTYPTVEQTLNGESYAEASSAIGGDAPETKLFWDLY